MKIVLGIAAAALALTACTSSETATDTVSEPAPTVTKTVPAPAPPAPEPDLDDKAYDILQDEVPSLAGVDKSVVDDLASKICSSFDNGASFDKVAILGFESGLGTDEVGGLIAYSVFTQCPWHEDIAD